LDPFGLVAVTATKEPFDAASASSSALSSCEGLASCSIFRGSLCSSQTANITMEFHMIAVYQRNLQLVIEGQHYDFK
jgi:hypothetical protein